MDLSQLFSSRLGNVETSAIRELFNLLGRRGIISFAGGFPDVSTFDVEGLKEASVRALRDEAGASLQYGATEGHEALRTGLAALLASNGVQHISSKDLIVTTGSQQALDLLGKTMLDPGDSVVVEAPTFLAAIQCFRLYGADVIAAPTDTAGVEPHELEKLITSHKPKFVYLVPTFSNPSGSTMSLERRRVVLALAEKYKTLIVEDDPYRELYFKEPPPPSLLALSSAIPGSREWIAYCGSLSKVLSPGLRVGWLVAPAELLAKAILCKQFSDAHTSTFAQVTAADYLRSGRMPEMLRRMRHTYAERASAMDQALKRDLGDTVEFHPPNGGLFFWVKLTGNSGRIQNASDLARIAVEHGVAFVPGSPFYATAPDRSSLRLSFAMTSPIEIDEGVRRLASAIGAS